MRITYNDNGQVCFDLIDLLDHLTEKDKLSLMESFACDETIVKHVADQILQGWTENFYYSSMGCTGSSRPLRGLDYAKRQFALLSDNLQKKEIERLQDALERSERFLQEYREKEYRQQRQSTC